jgi:hypothetical protein
MLIQAIVICLGSLMDKILLFGHLIINYDLSFAKAENNNWQNLQQ